MSRRYNVNIDTRGLALTYRFSKWEDNSTNPSRTFTMGTADMTISATYANVTHKLIFNSTPVAVQATVNGTPVSSGASIDVPEGAQVTVTVPGTASG